MQSVFTRDIRRDIGIGSGCQLVIRQIAEPFFKKGFYIVIECSSSNEDLGIARPADALIALRTIGRHIEEVATLSPDYISLKTVDEWIRAFKCSSLLHIGAKHNPCHGRGLNDHRVVVAHEFHILKTVEGKVRFIDFFAAPLTDVSIGGFRRAEVPAIY